ncbi:MAG: hypothetical protein MJE77_17245 [Proteobacteria bacterium]|nr:hypothetical protein [Pseudomonadota bacterium]
MFPSATTNHAQINQLLDGGAWACSYGQFGTLRHICLQLAELLEDSHAADKARDIAAKLDDERHGEERHGERHQERDQAVRNWAELWANLQTQRRGEPRYVPEPGSPSR